MGKWQELRIQGKCFLPWQVYHLVCMLHVAGGPCNKLPMAASLK
jgi:hypothetical protein